MKKTLLAIAATLLFGMVATAQITQYPVSWRFNNTYDGWTPRDHDNESRNNWEFVTDGITNLPCLRSVSDYNDYSQFGAPYVQLGADEWLISPQLHIGETGLTFEYDMRPYVSHIQIYIGIDTVIDMLLDEPTVVDTHANYTAGLTTHSFSLDPYYDRDIYIAIRFYETPNTDGTFVIFGARVRNINAPDISLPSDTIVDLASPCTIVANFLDGSTTGLTYTWYSAMEDNGYANTTVNGNELSLTYTDECVDTIIVTATNYAGQKSDTVVVRVINLNAYNLTDNGSFTCDFEQSGNNNWLFFNGENRWIVGEAVARTSDQSLYISADQGYTNSYTADEASWSYAVRAINIPTNGMYQYSFDWYAEGRVSQFDGSAIDYMSVWFTTDLHNLQGNQSANTSGWTRLGPARYYNSPNWQKASGVLNVDTGMAYIVFVWYNREGTTQYGEPTQHACAIDNLSFRQRTCAAPSDLTVVSTTENSITISWTDLPTSSRWQYTIDNNTYNTISTNPYTITDLDYGTYYTVGLRTQCQEGDESIDVSTVAFTQCPTISELPWREDFSRFDAGDGADFDNCWFRGQADNYRPLPYVVSLNGNNAIYLRGFNDVSYEANKWTFFALPAFSTTVSDLLMSFDMRKASGTTNGSVIIGLIDSANHVSNSLQVIDTVRTTTVEWQTYYVDFSDYAGSYTHIVFFTDMNLGAPFSNDVYIDNIEVYTEGACLKPTNVTVAQVGTEDATLTFTHNGASAHNYELEYREYGSDDDWESEVSNATTIYLQSLEPGTMYEYRLRSVCTATDKSSAAEGFFTTLCEETADQYVQTWEDNSVNCWHTVGVSEQAGVAWHLASGGQQMQGQYAMCSNSGYEYFGPINEWLISPAFTVPVDADVNLSFSWYGRSTVNTLTTVPHPEEYWVLVSFADGYDTNTYTDTLAFVSGESEWTRHTVRISQYAGQKMHFAFVHRFPGEASAPSGVYIDSVTINVSNMPVPTISGNAIASVGIDATFIASLLEGGEEDLEYAWSSTMVGRGDAEVVETDAEDHYVLNYSATGYDTITVYALNAFGDDSATFVVRVRNLNIVSLPYTTGFETDAENSLWNFDNDANGWYIGTAVAVDGNKAMYVSNNAGVDNNYTIGNRANYSYAYIGVVFEDAGEYSIGFNWHGDGSVLGSSNPTGAMHVTFVPLNKYYEAGQNLTIDDNCVVIRSATNYTFFSGATSWEAFSATFDVTKRDTCVLLIWWHNGTSGSERNPAAAIDNLSINALSCPTPSDLNKLTDDGESMSLFWHAGGSEAKWEVTVDNQAPVVVTSRNYTATGLSANTEYSVRVRAICGEGDTSFAVMRTFTTGCMSVRELPWIEDFNSYPVSTQSVDIDCWTHMGGGRISTSRAHSLTGSNSDVSMRLLHGNDRDTVAVGALLPDFYIPTNFLELSFYVLRDGDDPGTLEVGYLTYATDITSFVPLRTFTANNVTANQFVQQTVQLDSVPANARLMFRLPYSGYVNEDFWYIDEVKVDTVHGGNVFQCAAPAAPVADRLTASTYRLTWQAAAAETSWQIERVEGTDTMVTTVNNTPLRVYNDLEVGHTYRFRVKALCTSVSESEWSEATVVVPTEDNTGIDAAGMATFVLSPNPATHSVTVALAEHSGTATIAIVDMNGRTVEQRETTTAKCTVDLSTYARGAYFVRVTSAAGTSVRKLIVK